MNITRRSALLGTAAAVSVAATVAMAEHLTQTTEDAHLEALYAEWCAADKAWSAANNRKEECWSAARDACPSIEVAMPDGSTRSCESEASIREATSVWWLDHPELKGRHWTKPEAEAFARVLAAPTAEAKREPGLEYNRLFEAGIAPFREEIEGRENVALAELRQRQAEHIPPSADSSLEALKAAEDEANEQEDAAYLRFLLAPATTPQGMLVKLRYWVEFNTEGEDGPPIDQRPIEDVPWDHQPVASVIRDLQRMAGRSA